MSDDLKNKRRENKHLYVGGSDASDMELDARDQELVDELAGERKKKLIIAVSAILVAVIVVVVYIAAVKQGTGRSESTKLVKTYMKGLEDRDVDKVKSVMDPEAVDSSSLNTLLDMFDTYDSNGIKYTLSYTMDEGREAVTREIESVSNGVYGKSSNKSGIKKGYVIKVDGTIELTYNDQTSPYAIDMDIICYEKDGKWYLGGALQDESDTSSDTASDTAEAVETDTASQE